METKQHATGSRGELNEEIKEEIRKSLETKSTGYSKSSSNMKFIAIQAYLRKQKSQRNSLTFHLKELEKEEQKKSKVSREGRK